MTTGLTSEENAIVAYVHDVLSAGPAHVAFDGLRVLHHPARLRDFLVGRGVDVTPVSVELWPSLSCDARCPTCPYRLSGARDEADDTQELHVLGLKHAHEILRGLAAAGVHSVILTGGGEPLLHPDLVAIVASAARAGLAWALFTNGLSLNPEVAQSLLDLNPRFLRVSLDAGSPEVYARTYALDPSSFARVLTNVRAAGLIALGLGSRAFGIGFTLIPQTGDKELEAIRKLLASLMADLGPGLSLVAFRPRVVHYRRGLPVCPQPRGGEFRSLAERLQQRVVRPLLPAARVSGTRLDIKRGLFELAAEESVPPGCFSSSWMTNLDEKGYGYITAELAGVETSGQCWGRVLQREDFAKTWASPARRALYERLARGEIAVPPVHRTAPVDEALRGMRDAAQGPIDVGQARRVVKAVQEAGLLRSTNSDFI